MKLFIYSLVITILFASCTEDTVTDVRDYNNYLSIKDQDSGLNHNQEINFWNKRIKEDSIQLIALAKSASANSSLFKQNANIQHLKNAEKLLLKAVAVAAVDKDSYLQALAHNYITQHRFREAKNVLEQAYLAGGKTNDINLMLFDVYLELGAYDKAQDHLSKTENFADFNYLTRLAKWKDHSGDLDATIHYMEKALEIAENTNKKDIKVWTYTNLADYYGHAGRIKESYNYYIKALNIEPSNAYAKKGIAWIAYSHENNPEEALRIIDAIDDYNQGPDYHLLKAEIAEYSEDLDQKRKEITAYFQASSDAQYGVMYNAYTANVLAEETEDYSRALELALQEVEQRPTPQAYDLLAYIHYLKGDYKEALQITNEFVINRTYEPLAQLHTAQIYKANNLLPKVKELKKDLLEASYELGPLTAAQIRNL